MNSGKLGDKGELLTQKWYKKRGYKLLERNYRCRMGEIDLIVSQPGMLVFVEVKTRSAGSIAAPKEWVNIPKQRRIIAAAQHYLAQAECEETFIRFDVAEVMPDTFGRYAVQVIENAFTL